MIALVGPWSKFVFFSFFPILGDGILAQIRSKYHSMRK